MALRPPDTVAQWCGSSSRLTRSIPGLSPWSRCLRAALRPQRQSVSRINGAGAAHQRLQQAPGQPWDHGEVLPSLKIHSLWSVMIRPFSLLLAATISSAPWGVLARPSGESLVPRQPATAQLIPGTGAAAGAAAGLAAAKLPANRHGGPLPLEPLRDQRDSLQAAREAMGLRQELNRGLLPGPQSDGMGRDLPGALRPADPARGGDQPAGGWDLGGLRRNGGGQEDPAASLRDPLGSASPQGRPRSAGFSSAFLPGLGSFAVNKTDWVRQDSGGAASTRGSAPSEPEPQPSSPQQGDPQPSAPQAEPQTHRSAGPTTTGWLMDGQLIRTETVSSSGDTTKIVETDYWHGQPTHQRVTLERTIPRRIEDCGPDNPCASASGDPHGQMTGGAMGVINPAFRRQPEVIEALQNGFGRRVRPAEAAAGDPAPLLSLDRVDLVGQPSPDQPRARGGGPSAARGYNPNDLVRPPRPNDP
jgi:hypothetical protein